MWLMVAVKDRMVQTFPKMNEVMLVMIPLVDDLS